MERDPKNQTICSNVSVVMLVAYAGAISIMTLLPYEDLLCEETFA